MKKKNVYLSVLLNVTVICSLSAQSVQPDKIKNLKIQPSDVPDGFVLYQERLAKPGKFSNEQVYQFWRRGVKEQDLELIEETNQNFDKPVGASSFQKWYRGDIKGEKDKIEIKIIICQSESEMEKTIIYFTKEAFAAQSQITETPLAGEKSWIPKYLNPKQDSFYVIFIKLNVFVRVYVRKKDLNADELQKMTNKLAHLIENKIVL